MAQSKSTKATSQGLELLNQHALDENLDTKLIPANLIWGKTPTKERKNLNIGTLLADQESLVGSVNSSSYSLGRDTLIRFSEAFHFEIYQITMALMRLQHINSCVLLAFIFIVKLLRQKVQG
eukprot:TRINITY_DN17808_c0_g1_i1.p1 TRINITY_DN17808_c0_g1~~TRINITY_DN17808_c0_g1_i1.p1  ORF type:complete len:122 (+),score=8.62 TRINITY_DN17808_c0_g1_i1:256-621(+)